MEQVTRRDFARFVAGSAVFSARIAQAEQLPEASGAFAFGVVADVQYCDAEPAGTRHYRASVGKFSNCVEAFNQIELAFVIQLGDLIDRDFESFDKMLPIFNRIRTCRFHVLGNHDFSVAEEQIDEVPARLNRLSQSREQKMGSGVFRRTGLRRASHRRLPTPFSTPRYFAWCVCGWRFIVLDGNDLSLFARHRGTGEYERAQSLYDALKAQHAPNAQTWNGGIGPAQLCWLDGQLARADRARQKAIVFCHYPVYPENIHNLWNDRDVVRVLESHPCVMAYMNGHNHAGNYAQRCGIHYLTFPGMVETPDTTAYAVVQIHPDGLAVVGSGRTPSRRLEYRS